MRELLRVEDLHYSFKTFGGEVHALRGVSFHLEKGEILGIVGESGSGKSVTMQTIMGINPEPPGMLKAGRIFFQDKCLTEMTEKQKRQIRGLQIGMIFQDPMASLSPTIRVGKQMEELLKRKGLDKAARRARAEEMLRLVGISDIERRYRQYPFEFSGGMMQRVMIAMTLSADPELVIADEPTTSLDVTIEAQIIDLLKRLQTELHKSIILISHNMGIITGLCDRVIVMYGGKIVETGTLDEIFYECRHPYTWGLLDSIPGVHARRGQRLIPIEGTPPDLFAPPPGCCFAPRCKHAMAVCYQRQPEAYTLSPTHQSCCWLEHAYAPKIERGAAAHV